MSIVRRASILLSIISISVFLLSACVSSSPTSPSTSSKVLNVVAAENFYGNIVQQLGGSRVAVVSILSDPNADPHEYESSFKDAAAVSNADLVIRNGGNYDTWMDKLLSASPNPKRVVITASDVAVHKLPDNPHVWYGIDNVSSIAEAITASLKKLDAAGTATFSNNLSSFKQSLVAIQQKMSAIKARYAGTPVGLTETIYLYQTSPAGLNVLTPFEFEKAIAEGNDPPAATVATVNDQINKKQVKVLIYNEQTITPVTTNLQNEAKTQNIPIVPVTETLPRGKTYQAWMLSQLDNLQQALATSTGR